MTLHNPSPANAAVALSNALRRKQLVVICGTGVTAAATGNAAEASWTGLIKNGIDRVERLGLRDSAWVDRARADVATGLTRDMIVAAEKVTNELNMQPGEFESWLRESAGALSATEFELLNSLARLAADGAVIVTTNYDSILSKHMDTDIVTSADSKALQQSVFRGKQDAVVHLHGHWRLPATVVFGSSTYSQVVNSAPTRLMMQTMMWSNTMLFVGVGEGLADPNFQALRVWASEVIGDAAFPHYRLARSSEKDALVAEHRDENIAVVEYGTLHSDLAGFLDSIQVSAPVRAQLPASIAAGREAPSAAVLSDAVEERLGRLRVELKSLVNALEVLERDLAREAESSDGILFTLVLEEIFAPIRSLALLDVDDLKEEHLNEAIALGIRVERTARFVSSQP